MRSALSLFSGAGGMDLGVRQGGFEVLGCIEFDPHCCETLRANVSREQLDTRVIEADIRKIKTEELRKEFGIATGSLDLLFGGPPCQSFSLAGKQLGLEDERGMLLFQMLRFAEEFKPKVILMEQVKGLLSAKGPKGHRGEVFEHFLQRLQGLGYVAKWKVLLAAEYGVPQLRQRLFVVATRRRNGYQFPPPTHGDDSVGGGLFGFKPFVNVGDVLKGLGRPSPKIKGTTVHPRLDSHVDVTPERDRERISQVPEGQYLAAQLHLTEDIRRGLTAKDTTKYLRTHRKRPCNTLRCGEIFYHPLQDRYLTPREYLQIHGYPSDYLLKGPIRSRTGSVKNLDQHRQVANSVPPPLAKALAESIWSYMDEQNL